MRHLRRGPPWLPLLVATPIVLWCGARLFSRVWTSVRTRWLNLFTLIATGVGVAFGFSLVAMVPVYYEAAGVW